MRSKEILYRKIAKHRNASRFEMCNIFTSFRRWGVGCVQISSTMYILVRSSHCVSVCVTHT